MKLSLQIATICVAVALFVGYFVGRHSGGIKEVYEMVRVDTVFIDRPQPVRRETRTIAVKIPSVLFVERDSVVKDSLTTENRVNLSEILTSSTDSVAVCLDFETKIYEDSLYRAQVSGIVVGDVHPRLDWVEVYPVTRTITQTVTPCRRFAVTAGVGAAYTPKGFQPTLGIQLGVILWSF